MASGKTCGQAANSKHEKKDVRRLYFVAFSLRRELHARQSPSHQHKPRASSKIYDEKCVRMKFFFRSIGSALEEGWERELFVDAAMMLGTCL
jgi:hypothetical protein